MANAYGTEKYEEFRNWYKKNTENRKPNYQNNRTVQFKNFEIKSEDYSFIYRDETDKCDCCCSYTHLNVYKDGILLYSCICTDEQIDFLPYAYEYKGNDYIFFRKNLYGYTILNLNTLEEQNYFPSDVLAEKEAFIVCQVHLLKDILLLDGCYWACPYTCYLLDLTDYKTYSLYDKNLCGALEGNEPIIVQGDTVKINHYNENTKTEEWKEFSYKMLKQLLVESDSRDL